MKTVMLRSLLLGVGAALLAGAWQLAGPDASVALARRLASAVLLVAGLGAVCVVLRQRLRSEDRIVRLEADLCREQSARSQADHALAEADLLLARLTVRPGRRHAHQADLAQAEAPEHQVMAQLTQIQAELAQLQQRVKLDAGCAGRLESARIRLEQVARMVRNAVRAAEAG
jgi:hypothetical protein